MQRLFLLVSAILLFCTVSAQIISYQKIDSFTISELEDILIDAGVPNSFVQLEYEVDYYQVLYLTPYKHPDSLVQASAGLAVPRMPDCDIPISMYAHGTTAKRKNVASIQGGAQWEIGAIFASTGYAVALPDYLGLGLSDTNVLIHPYQHAFSQSNTCLNAIRAAEDIMNETNVGFNEQLFLFGYSQGGYATAATQRLIEEEYASEYTVTAAAPMSGAYDMAGAQVDLMVSDSIYPTPGYLPYIILAYQDQYGTLYDSIQQILKAPYDSLMPHYFYSGDKSIGFINGKCTPVPKHMVLDTTVVNFKNNVNHPLRALLRENEMLDWTPQGSVKIYYCRGDDQVSSINSERAYDSWRNNGGSDVTKQDFGNLNHNDCAQLCFLGAKGFFDGKKQDCTTNIEKATSDLNLKIYPNPAQETIWINWSSNSNEAMNISLIDAVGKIWKEQNVLSDKQTLELDISTLPSGFYIVNLSNGSALENVRLIKAE